MGNKIRLNMAMHVPKAPGFAQMLKEGAKVCNDIIMALVRKDIVLCDLIENFCVLFL